MSCDTEGQWPYLNQDKYAEHINL